MRILGHIHTFNDEEIIDRALSALLEQTYPVGHIVVVDNASTDQTLARPFPDLVTVIRHPENRGTSGAVITGMQYALSGGFDWIYLLDADSLPRPDALERLVTLLQSLPRELRDRIWRLSSLPLEAPRKVPRHGIVFTPRGCKMAAPASDQLVYECDGTIWSGSLYRLSAVRAVGLPNADYVLDWGEYEYGYSGKQAGYRAFMHQASILDHSVGNDEPSTRTIGLGPFSLEIRKRRLPPFRLYYIFRNCLYFWLHVYHKGHLIRYLRQPSGSPNLPYLVRYLIRIMVLSDNRRIELTACLRGAWDGLRKRLDRRY